MIVLGRIDIRVVICFRRLNEADLVSVLLKKVPRPFISPQSPEFFIVCAVDDDGMCSSAFSDDGPEGQSGTPVLFEEKIDEVRGDMGHVSQHDHDMVKPVLDFRQASDDG